MRNKLKLTMKFCKNLPLWSVHLLKQQHLNSIILQLVLLWQLCKYGLQEESMAKTRKSNLSYNWCKTTSYNLQQLYLNKLQVLCL